MTCPRILVAGIGNIFFGDDAFGVEVVRHLAAQSLPEEVRVIDFGIRGFDLAFALMDGYQSVILVDALPRGRTPGTLYVLEPDLTEAPEPNVMPNTHGMTPEKVLQMVRAMGGPLPGLVRVVGCEPATFGTEMEPVMGLSEAVQTAIPEAVRLILNLTTELLRRPSTSSVE